MKLLISVLTLMPLFASYGCANKPMAKEVFTASGLPEARMYEAVTTVAKDVGSCAEKKFEKCIIPDSKDNKTPTVPPAATNEELEEMAKKNK